MRKPEQGSILKIEGIHYPCIVVSNNFFNHEGCVIVCPIIKSAVEGPLHIKMDKSKESDVDGYILCEQVRFIDLNTRHYSLITEAPYFDIMDISDAVMSIFEYQ